MDENAWICTYLGSGGRLGGISEYVYGICVKFVESSWCLPLCAKSKIRQYIL